MVSSKYNYQCELPAMKNCTYTSKSLIVLDLMYLLLISRLEHQHSVAVTSVCGLPTCGFPQTDKTDDRGDLDDLLFSVEL